MAKKNVHADRAQAKAAKQKKVAIGLSAVLVLVLVLEVPKTLKMMNPKAKAPVVATNASAPAATTPTTAATAPPPGATASPAAAPAASLVSSVQVSPGPGQLTQFSQFASKDPFDQTVQKTPGAAGAGAAAAPTSAKPTKAQPASTPKAPPAPPPSSAVISVNGELMSVAVGTQFPTSGTVFDQVGSSLFQLDALTSKSAKVSIVGGSYASGAPSLKLAVGTPVTLQNTADGSRFTLVLEPQGTQVPAATATGATSTTPTATTPATGSTSVVPSGTGG